eukprot:1248595-Pleurochrysis_carterae.AAC.1
MAVHEYAVCGGEELRSWATHCTAQHADCVGNVGPCLGRAIEQRADKRLEGLSKLVVDSAFGFGPESFARGTPPGRCVSTRCAMYFCCVRVTQLASAVMSTFKRSEIGPSSSTFQREKRSDVNLSYSEPGPS